MKVFVFVSLFVFSDTVFAQDYAFKVLVNKGQNVIKAGNDWLPIKVGASLKSADELRISQNGYLGLVHVTGRPLEVKEAGSHKVVNLAAKIKEGSSVLNKYTEFILSSNVEKKNNLTATGAVYRGDKEIKVFLPKSPNAIVSNDEVLISWSSLAKTPSYVVTFSSMFGDELDRIETPDTSVSVDLKSEKFSNEDNILVEVSSGTDSQKDSEPMMLKKLSAADKTRIGTELARINEQTKEKTALNQLLLAGFYESHGLLIDASSAYQKAISLAPNVPQFRTAYDEFLDRNGLRQ